MAPVKKNLNPRSAPREIPSLLRATDEKMFRTMVNSIEDYAMVVTDPDGRIISWNKGAEITYGYEEHEIIGRHIAFLYTPEAVEKNEPARNLKEALKYPTYNTEGWRVRNGGIRFWADVHYTALYDDDRRLLGYAKVIQEVSNRKTGPGQEKDGNTKKQNLFSGNISFRKLIENSYEGITLLDKDLNITYRSSSAERINGWDTADRLKEDMAWLIHPDDREDVSALLNEVQAEPAVPKTIAFRSRHFNGHYIWVESVYTNFLNDPDINAIVCNFRDISEQKLNQEKIIESERFTKTVTDNLPALIAYWDADLNCLFANKPYCEWFDKSLTEMIGINKRALMGTEEFKQHEVYFNGVLIGLPQSFERNFVKIDGSKMFTHTQYLPDKDDSKVKGFYSLIYDITEVKLAEQEINKKTTQIEDLLENMTDGFISLDKNLFYTYANKKIGEMTGISPQLLVGKNVWEIFPDAINSPTYNGIKTALDEKKYVCNEDHYEPLNLWQENRIYPAGDGISMFVRDITDRKRAEQQVKQLNERFNLISKATNDALFEWEFEKQEIWWSESHFTMFDFDPQLPIPSREEWLAKILPESQQVIADITDGIIKNGLNNWAYEIKYFKPDQTVGTLLSRGFVIRNEEQKAIRMLGSYVDITQRKNEELQKALLADISLIFNEYSDLNEALPGVLELLVNFGNFSMAEAWLIGSDKKKISLVSKFPKTDEMKVFYDESADTKSFVKGQGLPGVTWKSQTIQFWQNVGENENFFRIKAAKRAGLKTVYGLPLKYNKEIIGVLLLGLNKEGKKDTAFTNLFENFSDHLGAEIKRKQLEQELNQIFNLAPDIICIAGVDGYFKKINPAMSLLLEYTELELLARPYMEFVHADDRNLTVTETENIINGNPALYFENRYITRSGKIKWLAWTSTKASEEGLLLCVAKDITDKKSLEELLNKATNLARIGAWEVDLKKGIIHWSDITREIHETGPGYEPDLDAASNFYKEGENRETIIHCMSEAARNGKPADVELQIVTAKGNVKWVRVIIEAEMLGGKCVKLYGSFQDIDARKKAQVAVKEVLEERNTILESIGDAFFAVDKNWIVTYWNSTAENIFRRSRSQIVNRSLLEEFPYMVDTAAYKYYCQVLDTGQSAHFEYYTSHYNVWLDANVYPAANGFTAYMKNITSRKNAESLAMAALEERNTILESIGDAFFAVDKNWIVTYWNSTAEKVLMKKRAEMLNNNLWEVFAESVGSESYNKYHEAVETNQAVHFEDYYPPLNKWYEISAYPSGSGLSVYFKDISERKISELKLRELNENLQRQARELSISNAELEQFAYVASHDLQEPLRMVTSFLTQLDKKYGDTIDDKGKQYIHFAVDGAKRMRQIILDLLAFSQVGNTELDLEDVDLNKLVDEIIALYRKQIEEKQAVITIDELPTLHIYKTPLRQVFQNLISNSLKYHRPGDVPKITISCKEHENQWEFSVQDNGIGIEAEYFDKIFIIFQRLHNKDEYSGTGMGLAITKKLIENMGGKIWVESADGKGSTFYFTILKNKRP